ncbi:MAG: sigma-70 family RNA polymerase sigma factor [Cyclobacteriaceae bacterium]
MKESALFEGIQNGERKAIDYLYNAYRGEFISWAIKEHSISKETAIEIYQDCVVIFYEKITLGNLSSMRSTIKTYLFGIGKNLVLKHFKKDKMIVETKEEIFDAEDTLYLNRFNEEYELKLQHVEESLKKLGEPCSSILQHYYYNNKSISAITELLQYNNDDTTKNMKYKCLQRLKKMLST